MMFAKINSSMEIDHGITASVLQIAVGRFPTTVQQKVAFDLLWDRISLGGAVAILKRRALAWFQPDQAQCKFTTIPDKQQNSKQN
ncbi:hypothetical protein [Pseudopelagicola sp. nBUS_19]|uniref:hypothetical protein n=1 Tax=unclassified Pseudopelagicola TaxID=2649563 RepID=UPI003EB8873B